MGRRDKPSSPTLRQRLATERWLAKPGIRDSQNAKARLRMARNRAKKTQTRPPAAQKSPVPTSPVPDSQSDPEELSCDCPYDYNTKQHIPFPALGSPPLDCDNNYSDHEEPSGNFTHDTEERSGDSSYDADDSVRYDADDSMRYDADDSVLTMDNDLPCPCDTLTLQALETLVRQWRKEWASEDMWNETYDDALGCARVKGERAMTIFLDESAQHVWEGRILLDGIRDVANTPCPYCRERLKYDTILLYDLLVSVVSEVKFFEVKLDTACN
ncbi:hypothetical protein EV702DRAFT_1042945 [Suillus placidus]|uniref:Uncharacterized protein n=1 Tax=Suillus placidus TaxID=48579 RepID=A0A9P7A278_9AGAM|nr:hypothetical protein EV702DRAFT_1042945 [Suillus placidus]